MEAAKTKTMKETDTNNTASLILIFPDGISRSFVLGFAKSIFLSIILLRPIAPDLALTIATIIQNICLMGGMPDAAIMAPVKAKGRAKMEWENLIILRYNLSL
ncbi:MAG: hypothetical protein OHK0032_04800 [Thermodesulfovibrionales bacterium]